MKYTPENGNKDFIGDIFTAIICMGIVVLIAL